MAKSKIDTGKETPGKPTGEKKVKSAVKKPAAEKTVKKVAGSIKEKKTSSDNGVAAGNPLKNVEGYSRFTDFDISLFKSGKHYKLYEKLGSHVIEFNGVVGTYFAVWAPNAHYVSVIANFNGWNRSSHPLYVRWDGSGIWEGFIPNIGNGETYKYFINATTGEDLEKADPFRPALGSCPAYCINSSRYFLRVERRRLDGKPLRTQCIKSPIFCLRDAYRLMGPKCGEPR